MLNLDKFLTAYIEAALFSTNDESTPSGGVPLDQNYDADDIVPDTLAVMRADCEKFIAENTADLETWNGPKTADEQGGYDFWMTRNGHGVGFWESEWENGDGAGKRLDAAAKKFGEFNLWAGENGKIDH